MKYFRIELFPKDYDRTIEILAEEDWVLCRPENQVIISEKQLDLLKKLKIRFRYPIEHVKQRLRKSERRGDDSYSNDTYLDCQLKKELTRFADKRKM